MKECCICGRKSVDEEFCEYHQAAHINLKSVFEIWVNANRGVTWEEYIRQVYELEETGQWVKEIIENIMSQNGP
ncbi:MAG: hypothetical protein ACFFCT_07270 [Candidatus Odinarchaeota archaeon]|nr:hypothetical protein [Candidatus Thorarchaeota archaeon]